MRDEIHRRAAWGRPSPCAVLAAVASLAAVGVSAPAPVDAQPRGSERGVMTQRVNGTTLTVDYSRPVARGRENLFGGVVHWGEVWTPGANWATTLEVDRPVALTIETEPYTWDPPPSEERAAYVGAYAFDTNDPTTGGPLRVTISVLEEGGRLVGRWGSAPIALVPDAEPGVFRIGFLRWEGEVFGVGAKR